MITRRDLLLSLPAIATARTANGQAAKPSLRIRGLNHFTIIVSDVKRSVEFYQGLFGMPIQSRQEGGVVTHRIGSGPLSLGLAAVTNLKPAIDHFCMTTDGFNVDRITKILAEHGVAQSGNRGAMKTWIRMRDETPEFYLGDPDGIVIQLQDPSYCGGKGPLGNECAGREPSPKNGLIALRGLSHFTLSASNAERSQKFYQDLFGLPIQAHQGAMPVFGVGSGGQFLAIAGGTGKNIGHACFTVENFDPDRVLKLLAEFGVKPRGEARGAAQPLASYVTLRMPDRGGAPGGTPELYFTDPDGLLMQIQDVRYCGGAGKLGELCSA